MSRGGDATVDAIVSQGVASSRSEVVRMGLERIHRSSLTTRIGDLGPGRDERGETLMMMSDC